MTSRADYLSKYLSGSDSKSKPKKKSKSHKINKDAGLTRIVVHGQLATTPAPSHLSSSLDADMDEDSPVTVSDAAATKPNKGFKRIDNGKMTKAEPESPQRGPEEPPQTVYRDQSGRIVDLDAKRQELKQKKEKEEEDKKLEEQQINTGDMDRIRQAQDAAKQKQSTRFDYSKTDREYVEHMTQKQQFDDPLNSFAEKSAPAVSANATGRPVYANGVHPINRFQLKAGHFWDGIDRSNGFEDRIVQKRQEIQVSKINQRAFQESYTEYDFD